MLSSEQVRLNSSSEHRLNLKNDVYDERNRRCRLALDFNQLTITTFSNEADEIAQSVESLATDDVLGVSSTSAKYHDVTFPYAAADYVVIQIHVCAKEVEAQNQQTIIPVRTRRDICFRVITNDETGGKDGEAGWTAWRDDFHQLLLTTTHDISRKMLVIINPHSGNRIASSIFADTIAPVWDAAGIEYDTVTTTHSGHAKEIVSCMTPELLSMYHGIGVVSGDGLLHEVVNGLCARQSDWPTATSVPIAALAGGSFNAMAAVIARLSGENYLNRAAMPLTASYIVAKQRRALPVDGMLVETDAWQRYALLCASFGLTCDVSDQEAVRWMPVMGRMAFLAVKSLVAKATHRARFEYLADTKENRDRYYHAPSDGQQARHPFERVALPPLHEPVPVDWCRIDGDFVSVDAVSVWHAVPEAIIDGRMQMLLITAEASRWHIAKYFSEIMQPDADMTIAPPPGISRFTALAYRLTLSQPSVRFSVDGEIIYTEPPLSVIQAEIRPNTFRFISR